MVTPEANLGAEDFANYMEHVPGLGLHWNRMSITIGITQRSLVDDAKHDVMIQYFVDNTHALLEELSQKGNA